LMSTKVYNNRRPRMIVHTNVKLHNDHTSCIQYFANSHDYKPCSLNSQTLQ